MNVTHELSRDESSSLINLLNKLPTETGVFPLVQKMLAQHVEQTKVLEGVKENV